MLPFIDYQLAKAELTERRRQADQRRIARGLANPRRPLAARRLQAALVARIGGWLVVAGCRLQTRAAELAVGVQSVGLDVTRPAGSHPSRTGC